MISELVDRNCLDAEVRRHEENQNVQLIKDIRDYGENDEGRNGCTRFVFGATLKFNLSEGQVPILTTKRMAWKTCLKELLWFISGSTDNNLSLIHI